MTKESEKYMRAAIREAKKAYALNEVPIGCVIVRDDRIIARGYNRRITDKNALAHAELAAIRKVIAARNPKAGCAGSVINLLQMEGFNHQVEIETGLLEEECSAMLSCFFQELREKKKKDL